MAQWLGFYAFTTVGGFNPDQGTAIPQAVQ